jgi:hypothetical protein
MNEDTFVEAALVWRERAAIVEIDGGLPRAEAERVATERVALEFGQDIARAVARMAGSME